MWQGWIVEEPANAFPPSLESALKWLTTFVGVAMRRNADHVFLAAWQPKCRANDITPIFVGLRSRGDLEISGHE